jgi:hypothetical protein
VAHQFEVDERCGVALLGGHECSAEGDCGREGREDDRRGPATGRAFDEGEDEAGEEGGDEDRAEQIKASRGGRRVVARDER